MENTFIIEMRPPAGRLHGPTTGETLNSEQQLVVMLVRVAVAASVASVMARFSPFLRMLMREERTLPERTWLALLFGAVFGAGVLLRLVTPTYQAVDLGLAGSLIAGLVCGYWTGLLSGVVISSPAMFSGEWMSMPMLAGLGLLGGLIRDLAPEFEDIWRFSPIFDVLSGYQFFRRGWKLPQQAFQALYLAAVLFGVFLYQAVSAVFTPRILAPAIPSSGPLMVAGYATMLICVTVPLKIWNAARLERKLESQNTLLVEARLAALTNQINPHFLFNTLNSIASLIRLDPELARGLIYKLSNILRKLLKKPDALAPLRDELAFIGDYMAIELVRFQGKLRFETDIAPEVLDRLVPSMLLQPLVENSIRHGLANKVEGGRILVRAQIASGRLRIQVDDDGLGMSEEKLVKLLEGPGIGVANVNERLRVLFGENYRLSVESKLGEGTRTEVELPDLPGFAETAPRANRDPSAATPAVPKAAK
jgi:two-component system LytT family sensor kinase